MSAPRSVRSQQADSRKLEAEGARCDVCGGPTYEARCKIICHRCGYTRDCSDP